MQTNQAPSDRASSAVLRRPGTADGLMSHFVCNWPRVIIHSISLGRRASGRSRAVVRARIALGALLPADVRVTLVSTQRPSLFAAVGLSWTERHPDGSHFFEGAAPAVALSRGGCAIRVTPVDDLPPWRSILEAIEAPCGE